MNDPPYRIYGRKTDDSINSCFEPNRHVFHVCSPNSLPRGAYNPVSQRLYPSHGTDVYVVAPRAYKKCLRYERGLNEEDYVQIVNFARSGGWKGLNGKC